MCISAGEMYSTIYNRPRIILVLGRCKSIHISRKYAINDFYNFARNDLNLVDFLIQKLLYHSPVQGAKSHKM